MLSSVVLWECDAQSTMASFEDSSGWAIKPHKPSWYMPFSQFCHYVFCNTESLLFLTKSSFFRKLKMNLKDLTNRKWGQCSFSMLHEVLGLVLTVALTLLNFHTELMKTWLMAFALVIALTLANLMLLLLLFLT